MPYFVAPGKSITTAAGIRAEGEEITPGCFYRGELSKDQEKEGLESIKKHVKNKSVVKADKAPESKNSSVPIESVDLRSSSKDEPVEETAPERGARAGATSAGG